MTEPAILVPRMREFGTTIFAEMSALAVQTGSINLGQGFPDTDGPQEILRAAADALAGGQNQYPPGPGIPRCARRSAGINGDAMGSTTTPTPKCWSPRAPPRRSPPRCSPVVTPGTRSCSSSRITTPTPRRSRWPARPVCTVTLERNGSGWGFDPAALAAAIGPRTRAIVVNSPHNPTGTVFGPAELRVVADVARAHDLIVVSDEVYEHLTFDGVVHVPIATLPGMRERTITVSSAGKTFSVTGWKIGWACAPPRLLGAVRTVKQFLTYVNGAPFQPAVAMALDRAETLSPRAELQAQRNLFCTGLTGLGFDVMVPQATYFATVDVGVRRCRVLS